MKFQTLISFIPMPAHGRLRHDRLSPFDVHISGETDVNAHNIAQIEQNCQNKTTIRFVTMGDSQRRYDETADFVSHLTSGTT